MPATKPTPDRVFDGRTGPRPAVRRRRLTTHSFEVGLELILDGLALLATADR